MSFEDENSHWELGEVHVETDTGISVPNLLNAHGEEPGVSQQTSDTQTTSPSNNPQTTVYQTASVSNEILSIPEQECSPFGSPNSGHKMEAFAPNYHRPEVSFPRTSDYKYPRFAVDKKRSNSFTSHDWATNAPNAPSAEVLVRVGFFYRGKATRNVRSFKTY